MTRIVPLLLLLTLSWLASGQELNCEQTLSQATTEFDAGRFYSLPGILKPCIDNGFSKEQKVRAYLLLTQAYLVLNDPIAAENSYLQLLKADPEYVANPGRDPVDVYYLSKKFTTTPVFTPFFRIGANTSLPRTIYSVNTSSTQTKLSSDRVFIVGYQAGGGVDWNLNERWSVSLGLSFSRKAFQTIQNDNDEGTRRIFTEKQDWLDIPIYIKYTADSGTIRPFGYVGIAANLLLSSKLSAENIDFYLQNQGVQQVSQGPDVPITYKRNFFNRSLVIGGGINYKIGKNFLYVDVRYLAGLNNLTKNSYTDANGQMDKLATNYEYSSDFFRLDNLAISVGYIKPIYDPRKKKQAVAGLLQKLGLKRSRK